jgi:hypothetical protein
MINADHYLAWFKSVIALYSVVNRLTIIREETQFDKGLWRYRFTLTNKSLQRFAQLYDTVSTVSKIITPVL